MKPLSVGNWLVAFLLFSITVFHFLLTWNDFQTLITVLADKDETHLPGEIPLRHDPVSMLFEADTHYGMQSDSDWDSLFGSHKGFIRLDASSNPFEPSLYHQLHCLNGLRKIFMEPGWAGDKKTNWHVKHCLNYLRQAILCNGDTTLEPSFLYKLKNGKYAPAAHGMGVLHECRDWTTVRRFAENNYRRFKDVPFNITVNTTTVPTTD